MTNIQKLCELSSPYQATKEGDALFVKAMRENIDWHCENNPFFRRLVESRNFRADQIKSIEDCAAVPFVTASFFKAHEELSVPRDKITVHLTSSGTSGQKSQIFFDDWSLGAPQQMIDFIFESNGWISSHTPTNYLLYSYETRADSKLGTAYTDNFLCKYAPVHSVFSALRLTSADSEVSTHEFDLFGCLEKLVEFAREGKPVRIFGFPAFLHFTLERMKELKIPPLKLSPDSLVFLGGGWKGHADKAIDKLELYRRVTEQLGIPDRRVRDGFGSVEHCIPYIECEDHNFHVPVWSRVYIRDVKTLSPLPTGEKGFLHLVSPYITSVPACSVLMGDLASLHAGSECPCPVETPYFVVHGRAGLSKNKSCAVAAAELLGQERKQA
jgi:phenylacetate-coenzyme A ligase PaaK-like adenylate-forming protein